MSDFSESSSSEDRQADYDSSSSDDNSESDGERDHDISKYHFCPDHKSGSMKQNCDTCAAALSVISDKELVNKLVSKTADPSNLSRYAGRCDDVEPTLLLSAMTVELARETFSEGKFRDRKVWNDIVQKYLTISHPDHLKLTQDISTEDIFNKFRRDRKYNYIFKFLSEMKQAMKDMRLTQRPIFSIIQSLSESLSNLRKLGEDVGLSFPETAPSRKGTNVPRGGRKVPDYLDYESCTNIFPCPDLSQFVDQARLTDEDGDVLADLFGKYREGIVQNFMHLYNSQATALTGFDDNLMFYRNLYSHADASLKDLMRDKMASLFKPDVKSEILAKSSSSAGTSSKVHNGIFGGTFFMVGFLSNKTFIFMKEMIRSDLR